MMKVRHDNRAGVLDIELESGGLLYALGAQTIKIAQPDDIRYHSRNISYAKHNIFTTYA